MRLCQIRLSEFAQGGQVQLGRCQMKVSVAIQPYIEQKRANGCSFTGAESRLASFCRSVGDVDLSQVTPNDVEQFLDRSPVVSSTWRAKYYFLKRFFEFWCFRQAMPELLMPPIKARTRPTFVPHLYTKTEIRALLRTTACYQRARAIDRRTLRILLLFLYRTGARLGEVL